MASWGRTYVVRTALLASIILLILLNFYNFRYDTRLKFESTSSISYDHLRSQQWPKRTRTSWNKFKYNNNNVKDNNSSSYESATKTNIIPQNSIYSPVNSNLIPIIINNTNNLTDNLVDAYVNSSKLFNLNYDEINQNEIEVKSNFTLENSNNSKLIAKNQSSDNTNSKLVSPYKKIQRQNADVEETSSTKLFLQKLMTTLGLNKCPPIPPNLVGPIEINTDFEDLSTIESRFQEKLEPGGWYKPHECNARDRVAVVIPYRDRATHLPVFLKNIHPFLMKQQIEYGIFLIEQASDGLFNRAALMNVGFAEALKLNNWDCFIFHDIDLIPMDDRNLYTCPDQPRHMSVAVDTMGFKLPYSSIFGGVSAMTVEHFRQVNGFSNQYWGWGGEDDDMSNRLKHVGYHIARYPINIARYTMLSHRKEKANPKRYEKLVSGVKKFKVEGLNSLKYKVISMERKILYTWIIVDIKQEANS